MKSLQLHKITANTILGGLLLSLVSVLDLQAQDQCVFYFPEKAGTEFELTYYDKKGKVESIAKHKVLDKRTEGNKILIKASNEVMDAKSKPIAQADYEVLCEGNMFKFKFGEIITPMAGQNGQNADMSIEGDYLTLPPNPKVGQSLADAKITMKMAGNGMGMNMNMNIQNRKVEAIEQVSVPAGTFECIKVSYESEMKMVMTVRTRTVEWFSKDVGLVKAEYFNKSGKKTGYTELTKLKR